MVFALSLGALPQNGKRAATPPDSFEIGRHTFFDFGPPNDFYEIYAVRTIQGEARIERITLTPPGNRCLESAKVEIVSANTNATTAELLNLQNPCAIPEKALRRELKRCKNCLVFSGANVVLRVQCGSQTRLIRADILDRDWFAAAPGTPQHTSWTMGLLDRLDKALGSSIMDKPAFPTGAAPRPVRKVADEGFLEDVGAGKYDALFEKAPDKPSELYRASQVPPPQPIVRLAKSVPVAPEEFTLPEYPLLARVVHIEGTVSFRAELNADGNVKTLTITAGHPLLLAAVRDAVNHWRFPKNIGLVPVEAVIEFDSNCPKSPNSR